MYAINTSSFIERFKSDTNNTGFMTATCNTVM